MTSYPGDLLLHLESFVALLGHVRRGKEGAFERAAVQLGIDRSVLRRRVQVLGEWIGAALLEGRGVSMRPTAIGARLAEHATRLVTSAAQLRAEVTGGEDRCVVGCTGTITTELLPRVVVDLERRPRPIRLTVRRVGGQACEASVRGGEIDVGVVRADAPPRGVASLHLSNDRLWFVLPLGHPLAKAKDLALAQMASVPLVLFGEASRTRARVMDRLGARGASIRVEVEGRSAALAYVRAGVGATFLSLLPGHAVERRGVRAVDVTHHFERSAFYVIAAKPRWSSPPVADIVAELVKHCAR